MPDTAAPPISGRPVHLTVLVLTVVVFAGVVALVTLQLRAGLREQILRGYAEMLGAVVSMQLDNSASELGDAALAETGTLLVAVLKTQKLRDVAGVRVFDAERRFNAAFPVPWTREPPSADEWTRLQRGEAVARLHPETTAEDVIGWPPAAEPAPAFEAWVPLRRSGATHSIGAAQFWLHGDAVLRDLTEHDGRLWIQAGIAWLAGSIVIVLGLSWAFRRIENANRELRARGEDLQKANRELVLAAKTSALGAVTAHLIHELKNPIAGLELIVSAPSEPGYRGDGGNELAAASELTRRLRTMVNDVVGVLRDELSSAKFELTAAEISEIVVAKVRDDAVRREVRLDVPPMADMSIGGRRANLATLILRNLLQNALEATPAGGAVRLTAHRSAAGAVEFEVNDGGPGLPERVRTRLFQPCTSTKVGGSGLGLALSQQLAQQAGGRLELVRSDASGTSFRLVLAAEA